VLVLLHQDMRTSLQAGCPLPPATFNALPRLAGYFAFRTFCTPSLSRQRSADHDELVARARFHLRIAQPVPVPTRCGRLVVHVLAPESGTARASVLVVHGWTSEASFMMAIAEYLRRRGYRIVVPDLPAHGLSPGVRTSLIECAHAVREVAEALGPISFAIGHSIGALAALLAGGGGRPMPRAYPFRAFALIASPNRFQDVTRRFGDEHRLSLAAQRDFERRLEQIAERPIADFTAVELLREAGRPALLIHSRDDADVSFSDAEAIAAASPGVLLEAHDGLGHRKILYAPPVVRSIGAFIDRQLTEQR
jgi:pimeloyl-ACP methyl ester carboxylesterase